jgi:hypothetical protein
VRARVNEGGHDKFVEVYMKIPLAVCEERDPKGLYKAGVEKLNAGDPQLCCRFTSSWLWPRDCSKTPSKSAQHTAHSELSDLKAPAFNT